MTQVARNVTMVADGFLIDSRYLIHDRDSKYCEEFGDTIAAAGVQPIKLPAQSPSLNSYAERWVRSVKEECLSKLILFGEASLRRALSAYVEHFHGKRNHQGEGHRLLFPDEIRGARDGPIRCDERLGGLLKFYRRGAA